MGWGEPHRTHVDIPPSVWDAAKNLAQRAKEWNDARTTVAEQRLVVALAIYEQAMNQPW